MANAVLTAKCFYFLCGVSGLVLDVTEYKLQANIGGVVVGLSLKANLVAQGLTPKKVTHLVAEHGDIGVFIQKGVTRRSDWHFYEVDTPFAPSKGIHGPIKPVGIYFEDAGFTFNYWIINLFENRKHFIELWFGIAIIPLLACHRKAKQKAT